MSPPQVRLPAPRITMIDGGRPIGDAQGVHLHDVADPALWARYNERVASGIQGMYTGAATTLEDVVSAISELSPGMHHASAFGDAADQHRVRLLRRRSCAVRAVRAVHAVQGNVQGNLRGNRS